MEQKASALQYLKEHKLGSIVETMVNDVCRAQPADPITFMVCSHLERSTHSLHQVNHVKQQAPKPLIDRVCRSQPLLWEITSAQLEALEVLGESGAPAVHVDVHAVVLGSSSLVSSCTAPEESPGMPPLPLEKTRQPPQCRHT